jgi:integrase
MSTRRSRANGEGSIFAYRNGFAGYVWVDQPNGQRGRKWVYGTTREQTHQKWIALQGQARRGPVATRTPTVAEYTDYWLREVVAPNLTPGSYATYESLTRLHIVPGLGSKRLDKLRVQDVQTWLNTSQRSCQCCRQGKDARRAPNRQRCCAIGNCCAAVASPATVAHLRRVLRTVLSQAFIDGYVTRNVASLVKLPPVRKRRGKAWTSDEARRFLESARADNDRFYAAFVLVLVLGLRKGEVLGLAWDDIDLTKAELAIGWQLQRVGRRLIRRETKTEASESTLPLPDIASVALARLQAESTDQPVVVGPDWHGHTPIFTTGLGTPVEPRNFNRWWNRRCTEAGVRQITVHDARRTCGSLLADLEVHPRVAMQILRHAQFSITMEIYTQISSEATRAALRRLGQALET